MGARSQVLLDKFVEDPSTVNDKEPNGETAPEDETPLPAPASRGTQLSAVNGSSVSQLGPAQALPASGMASTVSTDEAIHQILGELRELRGAVQRCEHSLSALKGDADLRA